MVTKDFYSRSRALAVLGLILAVTVIALELTHQLKYNPVKITSDFIIVFFFVLIIIQPKLYFIFIFNLMLAALVNIMYGGNILGLLFYCFGLALAMRLGFFRNYKRFTIPLAFLVFFASLMFQLKRSPRGLTFTISLVNIVLALGLIVGFMYLFHENLKEFYSAKPVLDLRVYNFTERQNACIHGCLDLKKLKTVAEEQLISESAIKREMLAIYAVMGVEDRYELYRLLLDHTVLFGEEKPVLG